MLVSRIASNLATRRCVTGFQRRFVVTVIDTADDYKSTISKNNVVVAKFSASWCKPCQKAKPIVEELSKEYSEVNFVDVDVDNLPQIADEEGVKTIPFFKIYKGGKFLDEVIGCDKTQLKDIISKHVAEK
ncbi:thioredoxin, putative [Theileria equi strain WA]|uniref:Thioredoxin, putative n=1 Tax=Theileria equi strain WA TaxID=1537102 RepID=L0AV83_THEEQ|nr:thioredoxin, putative [Theileria equi strain WA]AFZ78916.1 thioredoxin, putative [Theileria equi strain WA]|eukprot:XP_004828582.1 thioredoxin, putative [Theileria equi strain WA]